MVAYEDMRIEDLAAIREQIIAKQDYSFRKYGVVSTELKKYILRNTSFYNYRNIRNISIIPLFLLPFYDINSFNGIVKNSYGVADISITLSDPDFYYTGVGGIDSFKNILPFNGSGVGWMDLSSRVNSVKGKIESLLGSICSVSYNSFYNSAETGIFAIYRLGYCADGIIRLCLDETCISTKNIYCSSLQEKLLSARKGSLFTDSFVYAVLKDVISMFGDSVKEVYFVAYNKILGKILARMCDDGELTIVLI